VKPARAHDARTSSPPGATRTQHGAAPGYLLLYITRACWRRGKAISRRRSPRRRGRPSPADYPGRTSTSVGCCEARGGRRGEGRLRRAVYSLRATARPGGAGPARRRSRPDQALMNAGVHSCVPHDPEEAQASSARAREQPNALQARPFSSPPRWTRRRPSEARPVWEECSRWRRLPDAETPCGAPRSPDRRVSDRRCMQSSPRSTRPRSSSAGRVPQGARADRALRRDLPARSALDAAGKRSEARRWWEKVLAMAERYDVGDGTARASDCGSSPSSDTKRFALGLGTMLNRTEATPIRRLALAFGGAPAGRVWLGCCRSRSTRRALMRRARRAPDAPRSGDGDRDSAMFSSIPRPLRGTSSSRRRSKPRAGGTRPVPVGEDGSHG